MDRKSRQKISKNIGDLKNIVNHQDASYYGLNFAKHHHQKLLSPLLA